VHLLDLIEPTVQSMGYELVDVERDSHGLLRVLIDKPGYDPRLVDGGITLDDCERVSIQLNHFLAVENIAYERLEVSSPGLDRPLRTFADYVRFSGFCINLKLRLPVNGRRNYTGILEVLQNETEDNSMTLQLEATEGAAVLEFGMADIEKARLVPVIDFKRNKK
jgi:ribosome maturation factor RimP